MHSSVHSPVQQLQFVLLGALATDDQDFQNSPGLNRVNIFEKALLLQYFITVFPNIHNLNIFSNMQKFPRLAVLYCTLFDHIHHNTKFCKLAHK